MHGVIQLMLFKMKNQDKRLSAAIFTVSGGRVPRKKEK